MISNLYILYMYNASWSAFPLPLRPLSYLVFLVHTPVPPEDGKFLKLASPQNFIPYAHIIYVLISSIY